MTNPNQAKPEDQDDAQDQDHDHPQDETVPEDAAPEQSSPLSSEHRAMLRGSAIDAKIIEQRGYRTVIHKSDLRRLGFSEGQLQVPTLLIPIWNVQGELGLYHHRPDNPRMQTGREGQARIVKYEFPKGARMALDVHPSLQDMIGDPSIPLFITEGAKKADAAISAGLCCIDVVGVWNFRGTNDAGGKTVLADWESIAFKNGKNAPRIVYLCYDSDAMLKKQVHQALARLSSFLTQRGAKVYYIYLPPGERAAKVGLDDYLAAGNTVEDLLRLASATLRDPQASEADPQSEEEYARMSGDLPWVETARRHLRHISEDTMRALLKANDPPQLFVRGGNLVRVTTDVDRRARIEDLGVSTLRGMAGRAMNFIFTSLRNGTVATTPPPAVIEDILGLGSWPRIPAISQIVTAPVVSEDGEMMTEPGYHPAARLYFHAPDRMKLPQTDPTPRRVEASRELLDDLFHDFPFADDASRCHAWALMLLPFVRPMVTGPTPLHLIDAPKAGTGKGLLASICTEVFVPDGAAVKTAPTTEEEWTKLITTVFRDGASHLLIDNATRLNSATLFAALTSRNWKDRVLGTNDSIVVPNRMVWAATCNNVAGSDELTRRAVWIRLDAGVEQPDERRGFRHPDLAAYLTGNRAAIVGSVLTLIRSWLKAGRPTAWGEGGKGIPLGSFESWSAVMGGLLSHIGVPGFLANRAALRKRVDNDTTAWTGFIGSWWEAHQAKAVSSADLLPLATEWIAERLGDGQERSQKTRLGKLLGSHLDRIYSGHKVVSAGSITSGPSKGAAAFRLLQIDSQGKVGNVGKVFSPETNRTQIPLAPDSEPAEVDPAADDWEPI